MNKLVSLFCGIIFGIGLVISQMINPAKVLGFLNLFGEWDPIFSSSFSISNKKEIDKKLIIGSILFGAGWGLAGLCPGPAISSIALLNMSSIIFVIAMFFGFYIAKLT